MGIRGGDVDAIDVGRAVWIQYNLCGNSASMQKYAFILTRRDTPDLRESFISKIG